MIHANGYMCRESFSLGDRPENFYMIGSMGLASAIGLGFSLTNPDTPTVVLDGDGNILMNLGILPRQYVHPAVPSVPKRSRISRDHVQVVFGRLESGDREPSINIGFYIGHDVVLRTSATFDRGRRRRRWRRRWKPRPSGVMQESQPPPLDGGGVVGLPKG